MAYILLKRGVACVNDPQGPIFSNSSLYSLSATLTPGARTIAHSSNQGGSKKGARTPSSACSEGRRRKLADEGVRAPDLAFLEPALAIWSLRIVWLPSGRRLSGSLHKFTNVLSG